MAIREVLGHIDCPTCGTKAGMRITQDKNGDPFGYCEANCNQQMRIGGDKRRVSLFVARYPWAAGKAEAPTPAPEPMTQEKANKIGQREAKAAAPAPAPAPAKPRNGLSDALKFLGVES